MCRVLKISRSTYYYESKRIINDIEELDKKIIDTLVSGVLGVDPLGAKSSLFTTTTDQTSKLDRLY